MIRSRCTVLIGVLLAMTVRAATPPTNVSGASGASSGFAIADVPREFSFPRDHGPHPDFRHEWWYVTGNLDGPDNQRFGFELTFFRYALAPGTTVEAADARSGWRTRQIYMAHLAVTDPGQRTFRFAQRYARDALGLAGARSEPFSVWLEGWSLVEQFDASGSGVWKLSAAEDRYGVNLELRPLSPVVLNGDQGLSRKSDEPGAASYYYSIPRLAVTGTMTRDGQPLKVSGLAWLDREWGSGSLSMTQTGWDWFALQLADGSAFMFYALREKDGTRTAHSAGTWVAPDGRARRLDNRDVRIDVLRYWDSPRGGRYPAQWRVSVPSQQFTAEIRPVLADQELNTDPRYWEGAVDVAGTQAGRTVRGRGYVELVGYAR